MTTPPLNELPIGISGDTVQRDADIFYFSTRFVAVCASEAATFGASDDSPLW
jgi:hypothetical protein